MEQTCTRILLAVAFPIERAVLTGLLEGFERYCLVATACQGATALEMAARTNPDIVVIDDRLPDLTSTALAHFLSRRHPAARILLCCTNPDEQQLIEAIREGVTGFISREHLALNFLAALDSLSENRPFWDQVVSEENFRAIMGDRPTDPVQLTDREVQVLILVAEGHRNKEVARRLRIDPDTVDSHRMTLRRKLKLKSTPDVVRYAIDHGFVRA